MRQEKLERLRHLDKEIDTLEQIKAKLEIRIRRASASPFTNETKTTKKQSGMDELIVKLTDLRDEYEQKIKELVSLQLEFESFIEGISDRSLKSILRYRYVAILSWETIEKRMNISRRTIGRMVEEFFESHST